MARQPTEAARIAEHPLLTRLAREGLTDATSFRGYVGPAPDKAYVTLYSSLEYPTDSIEIARDDILHSEDVPENFLPFGAKVVWVRKGAKITRRHSQSADTVGLPNEEIKGDFVDVRKGRLQMQMRARLREADCSSPCSTCHSECGVCQSICRYTDPQF